MRYESPETVESAVALLAGAQGGAHVLAGGTDLLVRMRSGMTEPGVIVDIKRMAGMGEIVEEDGGLRIGAGVPSVRVAEHEGVRARFQAVADAAGLIGSRQIQGRATLSGNLCNASPAADSVPAMASVGATARIAGPGGTRDVAVEEIATGPGRTQLGDDEFVASIFLPAQAPRAASAYLRFIPRTEMDIAVVGCGVALTLSDDGTVSVARIALGAVAPTVVVPATAASAIAGTRLDEPALAALAEAASAACSPIDDKRGTIAFRTRVAGVLARRAALIARDRAAA